MKNPEKPLNIRLFRVSKNMEMEGFEPLTSRMRTERSPN